MLSKPGRVAGWSLVGAAVMYMWGFLNALSVPDIEEVCRRHNQRWEFDPNYRESLLPLSNRCNPSYDLVPPYVNPFLFALLASTVVFTVIAVVHRRGSRRALRRPGHAGPGMLTTAKRPSP